jgi:hypothetical protein
MEVWLNSFLTWALDGGDGSFSSRPLYLGKIILDIHLMGSWLSPKSGQDDLKRRTEL